MMYVSICFLYPEIKYEHSTLFLCASTFDTDRTRQAATKVTVKDVYEKCWTAISSREMGDGCPCSEGSHILLKSLERARQRLFLYWVVEKLATTKSSTQPQTEWQWKEQRRLSVINYIFRLRSWMLSHCQRSEFAGKLQHRMPRISIYTATRILIQPLRRTITLVKAFDVFLFLVVPRPRLFV